MQSKEKAMKSTIDMAREAGIDLYGLGANHERFVGVIKAFEALVRADERKNAQAESEADKVIIEYHEATIKRMEAELKAKGNT
jgi:hypothetical protein